LAKQIDAAMPLYFFHLRRGNLLICDARGEKCSGPSEAVEHAIVAALNLMSEKISLQSWAGWSIDLEDEARRQVATAPFTFVVRTTSHCGLR